ncbi:MAG: MOSC domain-containing protein [Planctomycetes bacterium]|nr:MOSC domain-containing protein [Planctomycetota bacterium]MCL4729990.1 MOSC domain-containing protein [Planctomycetota bacterium]
MTAKATITGLALGPAGSHPPLYRQAREELLLVAGRGVQGDKKFGQSKNRQVNLINARAYAWFAASFGRALAAPGAFGEQVVVSDALDLNWLPIHTRLRAGAALLEVFSARTPCESLARAVGVEPVSHFVGRVGILCRVLEDGPVRLGDAVTVV